MVPFSTLLFLVLQLLINVCTNDDDDDAYIYTMSVTDKYTRQLVPREMYVRCALYAAYTLYENNLNSILPRLKVKKKKGRKKTKNNTKLPTVWFFALIESVCSLSQSLLQGAPSSTTPPCTIQIKPFYVFNE